MTKCEECGNLQPGGHIEPCMKCGYVCHPVKTVKATDPPKKADKETKWHRQD